MKSVSSRARVALGGAALAIVIVNGLIALFGVSYSNQQHNNDLIEFDLIVDNRAAVSRAEANFKGQVQEWKNILLRGHDPNDYVRYVESFETRYELVREDLKRLLEQPDLSSRAQQLLDQHVTIRRGYFDALADVDLRSAVTARQVDTAVRGIDRQLGQQLAEIVDDFGQQFESKQLGLKMAAEERYASLRTLVIISAAINALLVALLLFLAVRPSYS